MVWVYLKTSHSVGSLTFKTGLGARNPGVIYGGFLCAGFCA